MAHRTERLGELGFGNLTGYLQARYVGQGWPIRRIRAGKPGAAAGHRRHAQR
jgi:hypothetical protein